MPPQRDTDAIGGISTEVDTSRPHPARVYNAWLGGKDCFAPDREVAAAMADELPDLPVMVKANRQFLAYAVRRLVLERGITQFLDIGSGLPTAQNVHEVAQTVDPDARVVYVDNDPLVGAHCRALMTNESVTPSPAFLLADARDPAAILASPKVTETLDLGRPVGLMLISMLMYFSDDVVEHIVGTLLDGLPSGSFVTISHPTADFDTDGQAKKAVDVAASSGLIYNLRTEHQIADLFDGLDLVEPGIVPLLRFLPLGQLRRDVHAVYYWVGMARKPQSSTAVRGNRPAVDPS